MKHFLLALVCLLCLSAQAQTKQEQVSRIRKVYADAKAQIAQNGKNGMAPLDVKIQVSDGTEINEDFIIYSETGLTYYFNKYRINSELDYPDASSCYFIVENWTADGHTRYREYLFDPNDGYLLFAYMKSETHAGFVVETRYYYDAEGRLIDQKHKVGGHDAEPGAHSWNDENSEKSQAQSYLEVFETLMNAKYIPSAVGHFGQATAPKAERLKLIRSTYAQAKDKIAKNDKSEAPHDMHIVIRDQTFGPPQITDVKIYYEPQKIGEVSDHHCYFISEHRHHNNMGSDIYGEYLFAPETHDLIFSYTNAKEEGEKFEWRYYYDENGQCIETKTDAGDSDQGAADKQTALRYLQVYTSLLTTL